MQIGNRNRIIEYVRRTKGYEKAGPETQFGNKYIGLDHNNINL